MYFTNVPVFKSGDASYPYSATALSGDGKDLKMLFCLSVLCYFAYCNPRGSAGLHFLDEQLRKIVPCLLFMKNLDEKILIYTS